MSSRRRSDPDRLGLRAGSHHLANPSVNTKKGPGKSRSLFWMRESERCFFRLRFLRRWRCWCRFLPVRLANRKRLDLPRHDLSLGLSLAFAILLLVDVARECSHDIQVIALLQFLSRIFREAVPHDNAVPLGFLVPLLVRTRPPSLCGERKDCELASRLLCRLAFRVLTQKAHQFDSILVHC